MRGSSVTSSGSQSPIFLVMFLNGRIHYAGEREWGEAARALGQRRPRTVHSAPRSAAPGTRGAARPTVSTSWPPRACSHAGKVGKCGRRQALIVSPFSLRPTSPPTSRTPSLRAGEPGSGRAAAHVPAHTSPRARHAPTHGGPRAGGPRCPAPPNPQPRSRQEWRGREGGDAAF